MVGIAKRKPREVDGLRGAYQAQGLRGLPEVLRIVTLLRMVTQAYQVPEQITHSAAIRPSAARSDWAIASQIGRKRETVGGEPRPVGIWISASPTVARPKPYGLKPTPGIVRAAGASGPRYGHLVIRHAASLGTLVGPGHSEARGMSGGNINVRRN